MPAARGVVVEITPLGEQQLVRIAWDDPELPQRVLACNLALVGANSRFAAV